MGKCLSKKAFWCPLTRISTHTGLNWAKKLSLLILNTAHHQPPVLSFLSHKKASTNYTLKTVDCVMRTKSFFSNGIFWPLFWMCLNCCVWISRSEGFLVTNFQRTSGYPSNIIKRISPLLLGGILKLWKFVTKKTLDTPIGTVPTWYAVCCC